MDNLKMKRKPLRSSFTKLANKLESELKKEDADVTNINVLFAQLTDKFNPLSAVQEEIMGLLLSEPNTKEDDYENEFESAETYNLRFTELKVFVQSFVDEKSVESVSGNNRFSTMTVKNNLPKLDLRKFDGDLKNWLDFWSQFKKIHCDQSMAAEDKFQYLLQCMVPNSRPYTLVKGFPPSAENYPKAIEQLQNRFGRTDLLIQVYVRELIGMVLTNAVKGKIYNDLATLYDNVESHLRSLESLGKSKNQFSDFLCPLVESCLPRELLQIWERRRRDRVDALFEGGNSSLERLMNFLKDEVNDEERINLAQNNFGLQIDVNASNNRKVKGVSKQISSNIETAASLVNNNSNYNNNQKLKLKTGTLNACIFCTRGHDSNSCFEARDKPLEERKRIVMDKKGCFLCLKSGHSAKYCKTATRCVICSRKHATILCPDLLVSSKGKGNVHNDQKKTEMSATLCDQSHTQVLLGTLLTNLETKGGDQLIRCMIDTGSQRSYICERLAIKYGLKSLKDEILTHGLFGGTETKPQKHQVVQVHLCSRDNTYRCNFQALTQHTICGTVGVLSAIEIKQITREFGISLTEDFSGPQEVELLIGADVAGKLLTGNIKQIGQNLIGVGTKLGWIVMGRLERPNEVHEDSTLTTLSLYVNDAPIAKLWQMDLIGINDPIESKPENMRQVEVLQRFMEGIEVQKNGRYRVRLPWKTSHLPLPDNKAVALQRLQTTKCKLNEKGLLEDYQNVFKEWLKSGFIEKVSEESESSSGCHYLPHRPVIKEHSTTRIRPVFDASSHQKGAPSLNDCLEKGINLLEEIPMILERFRDKEIGVVSDIEKAFLQLEVDPAHRDFLRFFGLNGEVYKHRRVVFGVTSSPFLLNAVLKVHLNKMAEQYGDIVNKLSKSFYVDNCVSSVKNVSKLEQFVKISTEIFSKGCFNLRGWESNHMGPPTCNTDDREITVLGLVWNLKRDTLRCVVPVINKDVVTKRVILSSAQKIFDPIGYLCPVILYAKLILQDLWTTKVGWDEPIPNEFVTKFLNWRDEVAEIQKVECSRYTGRNRSSELHVFTDASQKAYAACVFLRTLDNEGNINIQLLRAKSRVAPIDRVTIPRLELLACVIGVRLANSVKLALDDENLQTTYWSDSTNVLWWITKDGSWTTFVQNRIKEVRQFSRREQWRYVPGNNNPADLPSRGCCALELVGRRWWEGPAWLKLTENDWPTKESFKEASEPLLVEQKCLLLANIVEEEDMGLMRYFSSYRRIVRMVAWMKRFIYNSKNKNRRVGILSTSEIIEAEKILFRKVQLTLKGHRRASLAQLVKDEDGILRMQTKITERDDDHDFLYPIVLPGDHKLIRKLIEEEHRKACHAGPQLMYGVLRERYWIIGMKKAIRKIIHSCMRCKRYMKKSIHTDPVALPKDRVTESAVFEVTGIDLAGPLYVKGSKVWVVLFTCAVYRAVHLELVTSLSTEAFLQALRRFIARRGRPATIYSDNGTGFCGAHNELKKLWEGFTADSDLRRIHWKFNPPTAAWWGGWWERLIRIMKDLLKRTLHRAQLTYEELETVICECEATINSRPLTYSSGESDELVPLTPSLFLKTNSREGMEDVDRVEAQHLQRRIRYRARLIEQLKKRFRKEYLGCLVREGKNYSVPNIQVGDVVLIGDDGQKRVKWPMGLVIKVCPGRDGKVRCVTLKTARGTLLRPVQRVYPLEIRSGLPFSGGPTAE